jgi:carbon storage regulator CsrA
MLVLSQGVGEKVVIDVPAGEARRIVVVVCGVRRGCRQSVRLGFEADRDVPIIREELLQPAAPELSAA